MMCCFGFVTGRKTPKLPPIDSTDQITSTPPTTSSVASSASLTEVYDVLPSPRPKSIPKPQVCNADRLSADSANDAYDFVPAPRPKLPTSNHSASSFQSSNRNTNAHVYDNNSNTWTQTDHAANSNSSDSPIRTSLPRTVSQSSDQIYDILPPARPKLTNISHAPKEIPPAHKAHYNQSSILNCEDMRDERPKPRLARPQAAARCPARKVTTAVIAVNLREMIYPLLLMSAGI